MTMSEHELQRLARRRVQQKMGFYIHAAVFVAVNLGLALLGLAGGHRGWQLWPLAGWGIGLAIHGFVTFARLNGDGLREQMMAREVERLRQRPPR